MTIAEALLLDPQNMEDVLYYEAVNVLRDEIREYLGSVGLMISHTVDSEGNIYSTLSHGEYTATLAKNGYEDPRASVLKLYQNFLKELQSKMGKRTTPRLTFS